jgi:hypothetical protein
LDRKLDDGGNEVGRDHLTNWDAIPASLPISAEIDARLVPHRERDDEVNLHPVRVAPMILAPRSFLREAYQIRASEMVLISKPFWPNESINRGIRCSPSEPPPIDIPMPV